MFGLAHDRAARELWDPYYEDVYHEFLAPRLEAGSVKQV